MTDAKKMEFGKDLLKKAVSEGSVFPVLIMPQPNFPCMKPIPPFKYRVSA
jgi:hypothetical protein